VPVAWKTASNEAVKFEPRSRSRNLMSPNRSPRARARLRACWTVHSPGGVFGDAAKVHPAGCVLNEHQDIQSLQQHGIHVQEVDREDPGGLGCQELPPRRACATGRRIDARGMQDLPHSSRRHGDAEFRQFAVDPVVSP
jgi:hypothetical protein